MANQLSNSKNELLKVIGVAGLAAGIFNCTVGGGIFRLPGVVYEMAGNSAPLVYVICGIAVLFIGMTFAIVGRTVSSTGGPYAYVGTVFGPYAGYIAGVLVWLLGILSMASVATALFENVAAFYPDAATSIIRALLLIGVFGLLTWVNILGAKTGSRVSVVISILKLLPLLILIFAGSMYVEPANIAWPKEIEFDKLARAALVLMFAFTGVESALVPSGEVKDPRQTVPRALMVGLIAIVVLYMGLQLVTQGILGAGLAEAKSTPLASAAELAFGFWGKVLLLVGACVSMMGYLSAMTLSMPRALFALSEAKILPAFLSKVHAQYHSPYLAIAVNSVVVCLLAITSTFESLAVIANLSALLLYVLCAFAAAKIQKGFPVVQTCTCLILFALLTSIQIHEWLSVSLVLIGASVLYYIRTLKKNAVVIAK